MATNPLNDNSILHSNRARMRLLMCLTILLALILPDVAFGWPTPDSDASDTISTTCGFASDINKILNAVSIIVVTIAVVFSGYQIAFAHKRIGEVAPVLIGAILIGAAGQIAKMFLSSSTSASGATACPSTSTMTHSLDNYAAVTHAVGHYAAAAVHFLAHYA